MHYAQNSEHQPEKPIAEVKIDAFDDQYFERAQAWLLSLGCLFERIQGQPGSYHLALPAGTREQVALGQSTLWTHVTNLLLPDGTILRTYRVEPLPSGPPSTTIGLPRAILGDSEDAPP